MIADLAADRAGGSRDRVEIRGYATTISVLTELEATPTGVHKDRFTTLLFALAGRKRMRFWPVRPWTEPVSTITRYDAYLATSFAIEVEPGDVLYWPSSYYHVGEAGAAGGVSTTVNIGVPIDDHRAAYVVDDLVSGVSDGADLPEAERRRSRLAPQRSPAGARRAHRGRPTFIAPGIASAAAPGRRARRAPAPHGAPRGRGAGPRAVARPALGGQLRAGAGYAPGYATTISVLTKLAMKQPRTRARRHWTAACSAPGTAHRQRDLLPPLVDVTFGPAHHLPHEQPP